jgi:anti-sigma regulatory factor (Ser/Thr protein kinase)
LAVPETLIAQPRRRVFPGRADQIAHARDFTRRVLGGCPVLDEAVLLVSELATNAVEHTATGGAGSFDVTICQGQTSLLIAVKDDGSSKTPLPRPADALAEDGRGLDLVDLVADRWGYCGNEHGRMVWFELRWRPHESPTSATGSLRQDPTAWLIRRQVVDSCQNGPASYRSCRPDALRC